MRNLYKILFTIDLLHDYYADGRARGLRLKPDDNTQKLFEGNKILFKQSGSQAIAAIKCDADGKPVAPADPSVVWRFYIESTDTAFLHYTKFHLQPGLNQRYHFHNLSGNSIGPTNFLHTVIEKYNNTNNYLPGDVAANNSGEVFEAIKSSNNDNRHALTQTDYWLSLGARQFVSKSCITEVSGAFYRFKTSTPATIFSVNIFAFDKETSDLTQLVLHPEDISLTKPSTEVLIDMQSLSPGEYYIDVNGEGRIIFYDPNLIYNGAFGVVELYNHLPSNDPFALFFTNGKPQGTSFTIKFDARRVIWSYRTRTTEVQSITDTALADAMLFQKLDPPSKKQFISTIPVALSDTPVRSLNLFSSRLSNISQVPNPTPSPPGTIEKDGDIFFTAEKFLNY